jgi:hypothetical protein
MRKSHKLLAVVMWIGSAQAQADTPRTFANGSPAPGNTMAKGPKPERIEQRAEVELAAAKKQYEQEVANEVAAVKKFISTPRRLPNGDPACEHTPPAACTKVLADQQHADRLAQLKDATKRRRLAKTRVHEAERKAAEARVDGGAPEVVAMADVGPRNRL